MGGLDGAIGPVTDALSGLVQSMGTRFQPVVRTGGGNLVAKAGYY